MIAASAAAAGVYLTARSLEVTRAQTAVAEQGQLADRFAKAVDQLNHAGVDHLPARVGGIYALERLAWESPRDHPAVVEVLSAFIRTAAPRPLTGASVCPQQEITADVQAALTVLGRRDATRDRTRRGTMHDQIVRVDLRRTCLQHADLTFADLSTADLTSADLSAANLSTADLTSANLVGADLSTTRFVFADLTDANLTDANLTDADLTFADLDLTNLNGVNLAGTNLTAEGIGSVNLGAEDVGSVDLSAVDFTGGP